VANQQISKLINEKFDSRVFPKIKNIYYRLNKPNERSVAFVAGVQRSGTNMTMDVLERSWETDVYHERDERAFENYQMRDPAVIQELYAKSVCPLFVIKSLCELQDLTRLMELFSPARTVWVTRNYDDVVNSMLISFKNQAKQVRALSVDREMGGWWLGKGMSDETHDVVKGFATDQLDDASAAALQWYFRSKLFFEQGLEKDSRVLLVKYEKLVVSPEAEFERIFGFLGLKYSRRVSQKVFGSSIRKRTPPKIDPNIRALCDELASRFSDLC
jgi:hypothetical protein